MSIEELRAAVREWITLHDQLDNGRKALKMVRDRIKTVEERTLQLMEQCELDQCSLADGSGGIERRVSTRRAPASAKTIVRVMNENLTDMDTLETIRRRVEESREQKQTVLLKRKASA
jgi:ABC-type taurine transport system ATPase subunit